MKKYQALRATSGLFKLLGWLIIAFGILTCFLTLNGSGGTALGVASFMVFLVALGIVLLGIFVLAAGQLIEAVVDIAVNTSHLPAIAADGASTVSFFEHMSGRPHREDSVRV